MATKQEDRPNRVGSPRREGRRTTLRVPAALEAELSRTARELGTSANEALVHLAQIGAGTTKRQRDARKVVAKRRAAVAGSSRPSPDDFPSPQELREAILVDRS